MHIAREAGLARAAAAAAAQQGVRPASVLDALLYQSERGGRQGKAAYMEHCLGAKLRAKAATKTKAGADGDAAPAKSTTRAKATKKTSGTKVKDATKAAAKPQAAAGKAKKAPEAAE